MPTDCLKPSLLFWRQGPGSGKDIGLDCLQAFHDSELKRQPFEGTFSFLRDSMLEVIATANPAEPFLILSGLP